MNRMFLTLTGLVLVLLPFVAGDFYINLASQILIAIIFASSLNLLVGYGGLTSLGHATYLGFAAYACAWISTQLGYGQGVSAILALLATLVVAALFGLIALRASGLGFLMITLALSQVLWGLAYRLVAVTGGDNGIKGVVRPEPFGIDLNSAQAYYWFALIVTVIAVGMMAIFVSSAFGSALKGTRDQPRRMAALGHNVWLIRYITFIYAGFWGGISGLLYIYYHKYIHPTSLSITASAEGLLSVIAGGSGTLGGPLVGATIVVLLKNYASAYIERWNMLLGFVFLFIVLVLPEGVVPGVKRLLTKQSKKPLPTPAAAPAAPGTGDPS
jgi:branched-chain amino acid transport system permease protein